MTCTHAISTTCPRYASVRARRSGLRAVLLRWAELRRQRRALAELDGRLLRDIGIAPRLAVDEAAKPFWR